VRGMDVGVDVDVGMCVDVVGESVCWGVGGAWGRATHRGLWVMDCWAPCRVWR
jgi:hypothetical protein